LAQRAGRRQTAKSGADHGDLDGPFSGMHPGHHRSSVEDTGVTTAMSGFLLRGRFRIVNSQNRCEIALFRYLWEDERAATQAPACNPAWAIKNVA
jgi:hypothetical protein